MAEDPMVPTTKGGDTSEPAEEGTLPVAPSGTPQESGEGISDEEEKPAEEEIGVDQG